MFSLQITALLGVHTLGGANSSGFVGSWVEGEQNKFNNGFFKRLTDTRIFFNQVVSQEAFVFGNFSKSRGMKKMAYLLLGTLALVCVAEQISFFVFSNH